MQEGDGSGDEAQAVLTSTAKSKSKQSRTRGKQTVIKRSWAPEECSAVERHLRLFLLMNEVPGKEDCQQCIAAEPEALGSRDWKAVKYFVKNRIASHRRKFE
ncbi:uncharacterized protein LOC121524186 [Tachysurus ichikawai]